MRRWNGWGDETVAYPLPARGPGGPRLLGGRRRRHRGTPRRRALASVPGSRLAPEGGRTVDPWERLLHARGQSLPDWIALRCGRLGAVPDAVAWPESADGKRSPLCRVGREKGVA